ncbi:hypothetical protein BKA62DRAFT_690562 [Auriculariales sp. MPI-PUGE-AT-0066]|nr:hypothetical protein BKA62DRAFT_690562 [Auriculariales sp. MPI-PUGE-AT-0066]
MASRIVSASIGSYLLQGWTLTNDPCTSCGVPLMRRPQSSDLLCVSCNTTTTTTAAAASGASSAASTSLADGSDHPSTSRSSTPPTDPPSRSSSPGFPLVETPAMIARRAASDRASAEIGRRLLQGWTMLQDSCSTPSCYGAPLMRQPGSVGQQTQCVVCNRVYSPATGEEVSNAAGTAAPTISTAPVDVSVPETAHEPEHSAPPVSQLDVNKPSQPLASSQLKFATEHLEKAVNNATQRLASLTGNPNTGTYTILQETLALSGLLDVLIKLRSVSS